MQVLEHPILGVGLCSYCEAAVKSNSPANSPGNSPSAEPGAEPAAAAAVEEEKEKEEEEEEEEEDDRCVWCHDLLRTTSKDLRWRRCLWCGGESCIEGHDELLGCEADGCNGWFCAGCVRSNLGEAEVRRLTF